MRGENWCQKFTLHYPSNESSKKIIKIQRFPVMQNKSTIQKKFRDETKIITNSNLLQYFLGPTKRGFSLANINI